MHRPPQATSLPGPVRALAAPRAGLHHPLQDFPAECKMQQRLQTCQKQYTHWVVYPHWEGGAAKASLRGAKHRSPFQARVRSALTEAQPRAEAQGERAPGGGEKPPRVCTWRPWLPHTPAGRRPVPAGTPCRPGPGATVLQSHQGGQVSITDCLRGTRSCLLGTSALAPAARAARGTRAGDPHGDAHVPAASCAWGRGLSQQSPLSPPPTSGATGMPAQFPRGTGRSRFLPEATLPEHGAWRCCTRGKVNLPSAPALSSGPGARFLQNAGVSPGPLVLPSGMLCSSLRNTEGLGRAFTP